MKFQYRTLFTFMVFTLFSCNTEVKYEETSVKYQNITEYIYTHGFTFPTKEELVTSKSGGTIIEILVKEGQSLKKNDPIIRILTQSSKLPNPNLKSLIDNLQGLPIEADISKYSSFSSFGSINTPKTKVQLLRANSDGTVFTIDKGIGDEFNSGEVLMIIGNPNKISAKLEVSEEDIMKIKMGAIVDLKINAVKDEIFEGVITKISHKVTKNKTIQVIAEINNFNTTYYGLTVEGQIVVRKEEKGLCIPTNFLLNGDSIIIKDKGVFMKKKVKIGLKNENFVEVKDKTLKDGLNIYKYKENGFNF